MKNKKLLKNALLLLLNTEYADVELVQGVPATQVSYLHDLLSVKKFTPKLGQTICLDWDGKTYALVTGVHRQTNGKISTVDLNRFENYDLISINIGIAPQDYLNVTLKELRKLFSHVVNKGEFLNTSKNK